jgi:hypothetical protein
MKYAIIILFVFVNCFISLTVSSKSKATNWNDDVIKLQRVEIYQKIEANLVYTEFFSKFYKLKSLKELKDLNEGSIYIQLGEDPRAELAEDMQTREEKSQDESERKLNSSGGLTKPIKMTEKKTAISVSDPLKPNKQQQQLKTRLMASSTQTKSRHRQKSRPDKYEVRACYLLSLSKGVKNGPVCLLKLNYLNILKVFVDTVNNITVLTISYKEVVDYFIIKIYFTEHIEDNIRWDFAHQIDYKYPFAQRKLDFKGLFKSQVKELERNYLLYLAEKAILDGYLIENPEISDIIIKYNLEEKSKHPLHAVYKGLGDCIWSGDKKFIERIPKKILTRITKSFEIINDEAYTVVQDKNRKGVAKFKEDEIQLFWELHRIIKEIYYQKNPNNKFNEKKILYTWKTYTYYKVLQFKKESILDSEKHYDFRRGVIDKNYNNFKKAETEVDKLCEEINCRVSPLTKDYCEPDYLTRIAEFVEFYWQDLYHDKSHSKEENKKSLDQTIRSYKAKFEFKLDF